MRTFDTVVIGAGVAGLTAALHAARFGLSVAAIDRMGIGGQIASAEQIQNAPGYPQAITGAELGPHLHEQAEAAGAEFILDSIEAISAIPGGFRIDAAMEQIEARTVIIAAGSALRHAGIPGEAEFAGRGVSHCASCDGHFFIGQPVCVIGGGDAAMDEALVLADHASAVTVFHRGQRLRAQQATAARAMAHGRIEVQLDTAVEEIIGEGKVTGVRVRSCDGARVHPAAGVFVYVGLEPNTAFLGGLVPLDADGRVATDIMMRTPVAGVFAAGDIRSGSVSLVASSIGDGATAAVAAYRHLRESG